MGHAIYEKLVVCPKNNIFYNSLIFKTLEYNINNKNMNILIENKLNVVS